MPARPPSSAGEEAWSRPGNSQVHDSQVFGADQRGRLHIQGPAGKEIIQVKSGDGESLHLLIYFI